MSATDMLREDHRQARRLGEVILRCQAGIKEGMEIPIADLEKIARIIEDFLDSIHYSREEDSYFPCVATYGSLKEEMRVLLIEHEFSRNIAAKIKKHVARLKAGEDAREPVARYLNTYSTYLWDHMRKEDEFFDRAEAAVLSKEEESDMYEQFRSVIAVSRKLDDMVKEIDSLESTPWFAALQNSLLERPGFKPMKPFVLWMTGLPCSGKTSLVKDLQRDIPNLAMLDGDELREWFSPKDFTKAGRDEHNKRVAHLAKLLLKHGVPSAVSLVSPYLENRESARSIVDAGGQFAECYVKCSLAKCEERDVKGMYAKARKGEIKGFTGIDDPYEAPEKADLVVDTENEPLSASAAKVREFLKGRGLI